MKLNRLQPRLVVVTGAGSGIGRATAIRFAKRGAHVVASDIDLAAAEVTTETIRANGHSASAARLDVTDPDAWESFADGVLEEFGVSDVLVNNAGIVVAGDFLDMTAEAWDRQLGPNLTGVVHGCRVFGRQMVEHGEGGHIVNIASAASYAPLPGTSAYCVSKAGVRMLTECLRVELGPRGIGVSAVCPGVINTNLFKNADTVGIDADLIDQGKDVLQQIRDYAAKLPVQPLSPDLVARAAVRAVRFDLNVVPVRTEAWLTYGLSRVAPSLTRAIVRQFPVSRLETGGARLLTLLNRDREAAGEPIEVRIYDADGELVDTSVQPNEGKTA
ncbi:SDR family NAD(P)-dependent oxidoreductase [Mycobacterium sp. IS-3022]|uniref:SDR family NAD(P)-dependent oxidoreductase n=1 Tax=Mycobacterium sp. IS-3022 TaxID=1772277 RepID=UPI0009EC4779|nr:SDR family NAD(P)-dependent oxidoreductase [Mycobacterium sp. IS-3022]